MLENKSGYSEMIKSMVHGCPSNSNPSRSCMYQILQWDARQKKSTHPSSNAQIHQCHQSESCEKESPKDQQTHQVEGKTHNQTHEREKQDTTKGNDMNCIVHKQGHKIRNQLYMYEEVKLKKCYSVDFEKTKNTVKSPRAKPKETIKLDPNNQKDRELIDEREAKIKQFHKYSRDLPNSAFVTYYGKPAFEAYGRCSSHKNMKSHNVMPHKGSNHPQRPQSHYGALIQGKKINNQSHLPRKPIDNLSKPFKTEAEDVQSIENLPLEKPDLINHVRFANTEQKNSKKQRIPTATSSGFKKKTNFKPKQKNRKKYKNVINTNDGLKYMNLRSNLLELFEKKKKKDSKLAYKVTECYPLNWECQQACTISGKDEELDGVRAAGKAFKKGDKADDLIYHKG